MPRLPEGQLWKLPISKGRKKDRGLASKRYQSPLELMRRPSHTRRRVQAQSTHS